MVDTELAPNFAVTRTASCADTAVVLAAKLALVLPAAIVTEAGSRTLGELADRLTTKPLVGAGAFRVTVPVVFEPPGTVAGARLIDASPTGTTVRTVVTGFPLRLAVIVDGVGEVTADVVTIKEALDWPDEINTEFGSEAIELLELSPMISPLGPATPLSWIVPVEEAPPTTEDGLKLTDTSAGAVIVRLACTEAPLNDAVIIAFLWTGTPTVAIVNVAET